MKETEVKFELYARLIAGPIAFDVDDPLNPKSWSEGRRWYISVAATVGGTSGYRLGANLSAKFDFCVVGTVRRIAEYSGFPRSRTGSLHLSRIHVYCRIRRRSHCFCSSIIFIFRC